MRARSGHSLGAEFAENLRQHDGLVTLDGVTGALDQNDAGPRQTREKFGHVLVVHHRSERHAAHECDGHRERAERVPQIAHRGRLESGGTMLLVAPYPGAVASLDGVVQDAAAK